MTIVTQRAETIDFLEPPRQTADANENFAILQRWTWRLTQEVIRQVNLSINNQNQILDVLDAVAAIAPIDDPATATTQEVAEKVNEIIAALNPAEPEEPT